MSDSSIREQGLGRKGGCEGERGVKEPTKSLQSVVVVRHRRRRISVP